MEIEVGPILQFDRALTPSQVNKINHVLLGILEPHHVTITPEEIKLEFPDSVDQAKIDEYLQKLLKIVDN